MRIDCLIVQRRTETWFQGKRDEKEVLILTCLDTDPVETYPQTFDYRPSEEEQKSHDFSKVMTPLSLSVRDIKAGKSGRYVFVGRVVGNGVATPPPAPKGAKA